MTIQVASASGPAPAPYDWLASGKPGSNGDFNLYVTDKSGRKIAAIWGKRGEREATAKLFVFAPRMLAALRMVLPFAEDESPFGEHIAAIQVRALLKEYEVMEFSK
jgi:hypothetical protein